MDALVLTACVHAKRGTVIGFGGTISALLFLMVLFHSMQELEDQVFDILSLWASAFQGNPERHISETKDLQSNIRLDV